MPILTMIFPGVCLLYISIKRASIVLCLIGYIMFFGSVGELLLRIFGG
jgi:hypothetical protein